MSDEDLKAMLSLVATVPAMSVNKVYVTIFGGIGRMTFTEVFGPDLEAPRVAVSVTTETLVGMREAISESLRMAEQSVASGAHASHH